MLRSQTSVATLIVILAAATGYAQTTTYVDVDATEPPDGLSWCTAFTDLQDALGAALPGDQIRVAEGTYKPDSGAAAREATFQLQDGVAIYGGYAGCNEPNPNKRDIVAYSSILSGDIGAIGDSSDNSYHVVTGSGTGSTAVLDGFTITGGNANGVFPPASLKHGGGMRNSDGSPTLVNCTFYVNSAAEYGGGMYNWDHSSPTLINCCFIGNSAEDQNSGGGAMYNGSFSNPALINCLLLGNQADDGGGIYNYASSDPILTNCTFAENRAIGGAMYSRQGCNPILTNCILWSYVLPEVWEDGASQTTIIHSDVQGGWEGLGWGNINAPPEFADPDNNDYRLGAGSPCIDAGSNGAVPPDTADLDGDGNTAERTSLDLGGELRFVDDPDTEDTGVPDPPEYPEIVDMGAYEVAPSRLYVDAAAGGRNAGTSWWNAYTELQDALDHATASLGVVNEIWVAAATYKPDRGTGDREATFQLLSGMAIYGAFPTGGGDGTFEARDLANETVLSGDLGVIDDPADNCYHVVTGTLVDNEAVLDGFVITGGNASGGGTNSRGGGMYNQSGSPHVVNCTFRENLAGYGAGMANWDHSSPMLANCVFDGNTTLGTNYQGGGMDNYDHSNPTLVNCVFSDNSAPGGTGRGGGMRNYKSGPALTNCVFVANSAGWRGGGMYNERDCSPTLVNCTFSANSAPTGPALACYSMNQAYPSDLNLTNCILWDGGDEIASLDGSAIAVTYSCVQDAVPGDGDVYPGQGNIDLDPLLVHPVDDPRLSPGSPCIDVGNDLAVPPDLADLDNDGEFAERTPLDLNLAPRFADDPGSLNRGVPDPPNYPQIVDLGAHEFQDTTPAPPRLYVDLSATGLNNGTSWADAYTDLQDALEIADGLPEMVDDIWVAAATYKPDRGGGDRAATFHLVSGVAIYGAFPPGGGDGTFGARACSNPDFETVLSGDIGVVDDPNDNSYHVVNGSDVDSSAVLDCFTITRGNADGVAGIEGGGMLNASGSPTVSNCTFIDNSAELGGGMYNSPFADPIVTNCTFSDNSAQRGGGMYNAYFSNPTLTDCTLAGNIAEQDGGAMFNDLSGPQLTGCTLSDNIAGDQGGGLHNMSSSSPALSHCTFVGNSAVEGGGMYTDWGAPTLTNCIFSTNAAQQDGGGLYNKSVNRDHADPSLIDNCTFSANMAPRGRALACDSDGGESHLDLTNCILWDGSDEVWINDGSTVTVTYSCVQDETPGDGNVYPGLGNIDVDPLFVAGPVGWCYLSQLAAGQGEQSPCLDAGSDAAVAYGLDTRTTRTDEVGDTGQVDMGHHYLISGVAFVPGDFDYDGDVDLTDFGEFADCFTGPCDNPPCRPSLYSNPYCNVGDFENDGDVDMQDYGEFQVAFTGTQTGQ